MVSQRRHGRGGKSTARIHALGEDRRKERTQERIENKEAEDSGRGELELKKSQIREFPFRTAVFDRYSRVEKTLDSVITGIIHPGCIHEEC